MNRRRLAKYFHNQLFFYNFLGIPTEFDNSRHINRLTIWIVSFLIVHTILTCCQLHYVITNLDSIDQTSDTFGVLILTFGSIIKLLSMWNQKKNVVKFIEKLNFLRITGDWTLCINTKITLKNSLFSNFSDEIEEIERMENFNVKLQKIGFSIFFMNYIIQFLKVWKKMKLMGERLPPIDATYEFRNFLKTISQ